MKFNITYIRPQDAQPFDSGWIKSYEGYDQFILDAYARRGFKAAELEDGAWIMHHDTLGSRILTVIA